MKRPSEINAIRKYLSDLGFEMVKIEPCYYHDGMEMRTLKTIHFDGEDYLNGPTSFKLELVSTRLSGKTGRIGPAMKDGVHCFAKGTFDEKGNCTNILFMFNGLAYDAAFIRDGNVFKMFERAKL